MREEPQRPAMFQAPSATAETVAGVPPEALEPALATAEVAPQVATLTTWQLAWRRFKRHKLAVAGAIVLGLIGLTTILADAISPFSFRQLDLEAITQGPSLQHYFGTDTLGRDEFVRVMHGGRVSLLVGITVALSAGAIGTAVGAIAGFYGRWIDNLLMRITDLFLAIPFLVILIIMATLLRGAVPQPWDIVIALSLFFWMGQARIVRGVFLSLKEKEFVEAARASGASNARIIFIHMLPNAMGPIIVGVTLAVAYAILNESVLSFLGFGIQPPTPSWGNMLAEHRNLITAAPWLLWFPGLMILLTVLCVNFVGDALRDALDPHQQLKTRT